MFNNQGDSIQRPAAPTQTSSDIGEARPRLPQANTDGSETTGAPAGTPQNPNATPAPPEPVLRPFKLGSYEFTNLNQTERYLDKAVRIIELLDEHSTIKDYVGDRPVRITLHVRTTETPADVRDLGDDGVQINLASYYFEKYDTGYIMGMLAHEIGLHPLASRNTDIAEQEEAYQGMPLPVPGLTDLQTPRMMNTDSAMQAHHIMAAYPRTIRHGIYRDIVIEMAKVLARRARVGVAGAKSQDVTDLFDTYLMDLASIAVTSDYRMNAVKEPNYTARVYNAYKEMLHAQLAENTALRDLLPSNKSLFGVARSFTQLATSIATYNSGDSIQQPVTVTPDPTGDTAGEARPRLPEAGTDPVPQTGSTVTSPVRGGPRDSRPRFVVRSGFDARRFSYQGEPVTELTVRVALRGGNDEAAHVFDQLSAGVGEFLNGPDYRLLNGDRLHVTVEHVAPTDAPHLTVDLAGRDRAMDQTTWWADAAPVQLVHELTHQLGLRDEYRDADSPHRPHILGSLLGDLNEVPEDPSLAPTGLRDRHLALLGALIGEVTPAPQQDGDQADQTWAAARNSAIAETREAIWVDPVSLPQTDTDGTAAVTEVPAHAPQDSDTAPTAPEPAMGSFRLGSYKFTNLNQTEKYVDKAVRIVGLLDEHSTIKRYVGGRQVRITLHVRTTETPADVIDRGDAGVDIALASYYFEKYGVGYIMGMLAHEIGLHPLAARDARMPRDAREFGDTPLMVPGLETLKTPRLMNTVGAGQADHILAAFPHTIRHGIYRGIVVEMAGVMARHARVGVMGAKSQDVTDLIHTYLMDLATIAVTNDHRGEAFKDPSYTARAYNAYKAQFAAQLAEDSPVRELLPADKNWRNVTGNFLGLGGSVMFNNQGDSIQRPAAPTQTSSDIGEARPRLPQGNIDTAPTVATSARAPRDSRPRFVVRSGFDARRFSYQGTPVTELTVRVALRGTDGDAARVFDQLSSGVEEFLNAPDYRLLNGDRLRVTVEHVAPTDADADADAPHLTVDLAGRDQAMDQTTWWADAAPVQLVHELTHQLGLRDEYRDADSPHRAHILGSLLGDLNKAPENPSLAPAGLRDRHLALLGALIGDVTPAPQPSDDLTDQSWADARNAAPVETREAIWVDPVSLPRPADGTAATEIPAHAPPDSDTAPNSFKLGSYEFTNLNQTEAYLNKAVRIVELLDEHGTIKDYVGDRQVRITLHVRTTETPADVIDRGDDGVDIALASYYFEKYDIGHIMGMLAHEIGLHPLASRNTRILEEEELYQGMPLLVPGLETLKTPRFMNTEGAGQADHVMSAFPHTIRHGIYRGIVLEMAEVLARHVRVGVEGAKSQDVTDLIDTYLMDLASIAVTNDHRARAIMDPSYTARVYNAYKAQLAEQLAPESAVRALLPADKGRLGVLGDFAALATRVGTNNRGDSIRQPVTVTPDQTGETTTDSTTGEARPRLPQANTAAPPPAASEPVLRPFRLGNFEFTNLNQTEAYLDKAVRIVGLLDEHGTIRSYVGDRQVRITLHVRTTETPADVIDRGDRGVDINLASYYFEKYDIGYIMGMLAHEIGLHPLADRNTKIVEEEDLLRGTPYQVPGLKTPRFMNTVGAGQADHVMAALPESTRHGIYRGIVIEMAEVLARHARVGVMGAKFKDVTDLVDTYLMDLATIAVTNDNRVDAAWEPRNTGRVYNAYRAQFAAQLAQNSPVLALLPAEKNWYYVTVDFLGLGSSAAFKNRGDSIQQPVAVTRDQTGETTIGDTTTGGNTGEARPRLPQANTDGTENPDAAPAASEPVLRPFKLGSYEFTNLKQTERYLDKAVRIIELLDEHRTIKGYVGDRQVRITLHVRTTETPADVIDRGDDGVDIALASYYFEKYDTGYIMGMLAHEIGLHPLAARDARIFEEEDLFRGMPLQVPGLETLKTPRFMNTVGAGQADHIMAALPQSIRHGIYRGIVVEMAEVLARRARVGVMGAKSKDVTDLVDTYLMDLATIAVTNDHRREAIKDTAYTARAYNAYKAQFAEQLAQDSPVRDLLPGDKSWYNVTGNFLGLGGSVAFKNRGDSIQTADPVSASSDTGETRPRLPQGSTDTASQTQPRRPRDSRPRFVVRSGFDARRFTYDADPVTDLTVRIAMRGADGQAAHALAQLGAGVAEFLNAPGHRLPNGDLLHVTVEHVDPADAPHLTVDLVGRDRAMDQNTWWADADPVQMVHELSHQLGLRDEYRDADSPHRPHIQGSLLGDLYADPEESSLAAAGLRGRHLALMGALIGDVPPPHQLTEQESEQDSEQSWDAARTGAAPVLRESVWVDPVSLPMSADGDTVGAEAPARMPQDPSTQNPSTQDPSPAPDGATGNYEFTNLKHSNETYRDKAARIIDLLRRHETIRNYVGDRQVRITLHVRTTETPADVQDRGDAGVDINLASYYFEKYDVGYIMGMLAHEIGLHPLASRNTDIPDEESMFEGVPLAVPGLDDLKTPRTMNTEGAGQADHIMAAFPSSTRHRIYRDIVLGMARVFAEDAETEAKGAKAKDVTDLIDCYLMDLASIALTNDHRTNAAKEPTYTARVYNAYKEMFSAQLTQDPSLQALMPSGKSMFGVMNDFRRIGTYVLIGNNGDSIQSPTS
ncbi:hypothetical protein ACFVXC_29630 [Streptomyces sp. NPDC058257]|uniref:hypothetical protein n=1 Tax=Streptomyces sp. NPDC058257 TaxID=3346409 RepID=UPI0036F15CB3